MTITRSVISRATHLSIAWGVALAVITLVEWHSLERNPIEQEVFSPFITREISVNTLPPEASGPLEFSNGGLGDSEPAGRLQYEVEFFFSGPLFLAYFFAPILFFNGIGLLMARFNRR